MEGTEGDGRHSGVLVDRSLAGLNHVVKYLPVTSKDLDGAVSGERDLGLMLEAGLVSRSGQLTIVSKPWI